MECPACHHSNIDGARFCAKCGALLPASETPEHDPLIGTVVGGRFRIVDVLGEGGMGRVYRGEQQMGTSVRQVAVKTLLSQYARDPQVVARFMRECGTVAELEHPNTIKVYDFGQTPSGELYIAMELLTGKSLESVLEIHGSLAPERVDRIIGQVCGSLQEAHLKGIIHRDLKPANIQLMTRAGEEDYVKVLDFGIAKRDERTSKSEQKLTQQGTVLGTPPYMSPEQFKGQELDARSDIYSLGVMTYEMLTGKLPFDADTPWEWATKHMTVPPAPFESWPAGQHVPPKMKAAVLRALEKDREKRPATVRDFFGEFTLGTIRPSMLGMQTAGGAVAIVSGPHQTGPVASASTSMMQSRPGQTQIGEPLFAQPSAPAGRTMIDTGPAVAAVTGPQPMAPGAHPTTGSGQAFPAPPAAPPQKKSNVPIIAGVALVGVLGVVGLVFALKKPSGDNGSDGPIALPSGNPSAVLLPSDPVSSAQNTAGADASPSGTPSGAKTAPTVVKTSSPSQTSTTGTTSSGGPAASDEECKAAMRLAAGNNVGLAVNQYRQCKGPSKDAARAAIDSASGRLAAQRGCSAMNEVKAAASIGASSGLNALKSKNCK